MDPREQQPFPPNLMMLGPDSFPNTITPSMMMSPATAQFPMFTNNPLPQSDLYNNSSTNVNNETLNPYVVAPESFKRKRGRPRKYPSTDGNTALGLASTHVSPSSSVKKNKGRGRPLGSKNKKLDALGGLVAANFTPHVFFVEPGEDIAAKIMAFCEQGRRAVIILSANGSISSVSLRHPTEARAIVTYKGDYELISLSGSFQLPAENSCGRMSGLSVSVGGLDGVVIGGKLAGRLTAASTIQVVVGSFNVDGTESSSNNLGTGPSSTPSSQRITLGASVTQTSPSSQEPATESSDDNENDTFTAGLGLYNHDTPALYYRQLLAALTR